MLLAAGEISDWIEGVILLLVVGGSVLASIAKPLIKKFGGEVPDEAEKRRGEASRPQPARPMPARPRPQPATELSEAKARPAQPVPPFVATSVPPTPRRPVARPSPSRSVRVKPRAAAQHERDLSEHHLAKFHSELEERHLKAATPSEGVMHPGTEAAHVEASVVSHVDEEMDAIRHPTRTALRRAIVMNEILGPPISLRPPDV